MPIYLDTNKVKNLWIGGNKVKNIWVDTNKVYSSGFAQDKQFMAYGENGIIFSNDGVNWTLKNGSDTIRQMVYNNGTFYRMATYYLYTSTNQGTSWTEKASVGTTIHYGLAYGEKTIVTTGMSIYATTNGIAWYQYSTPETIVVNPKYLNGNWFVGSGSESSIYKSSSYASGWTKYSLGGAGTMRDACYGNGKYVAVGYGLCSYSTNGTSWTLGSGIGNYNYKGVVYGNGKFVLVGDQYAYYSTDGINWTECSGIDKTITNSLSGVAYSNGMFVCVGQNVAYYSTNGISWNKTNAIPNSLTLAGIVSDET